MGPTAQLPPRKPVDTAIALPITARASYFLSAQYRAGPGEQLTQVERFEEIVVRPEFEADDAIDLVLPLASDDDNRNVGPLTQLAKHVEPIVRSKLNIENYKAVRDACKLLREVGGIYQPFCGAIMRAEIGNDRIAHFGIIIYDENSPGTALQRVLNLTRSIASI
ncbi:hypothetical protein PMI02_03785 [Novosphingobium sp. AP12]|nr:hypothetical protein PMI02_03785 [Novosphingobium sp. AP12]